MLKAISKNSEIILVSPFSYDYENNFNVNVDAVISRHSGAKTKNGSFFPLGYGYISWWRNNSICV